MENNTHLKCDHSPAGSVADSFDSIPTSFYQPLFDSTMNPIEALTPQSVDGDSNFNCNMIVRAIPEKKPIKKRKSWGQQLPEPKTNLPPRYALPPFCLSFPLFNPNPCFKIENAQRQTMKRNSDALSVSSVIAELLNPHANENVKKSKLWSPKSVLWSVKTWILLCVWLIWKRKIIFFKKNWKGFAGPIRIPTLIHIPSHHHLVPLNSEKPPL